MHHREILNLTFITAHTLLFYLLLFIRRRWISICRDYKVPQSLVLQKINEEKERNREKEKRMKEKEQKKEILLLLKSHF